MAKLRKELLRFNFEEAMKASGTTVSEMARRMETSSNLNEYITPDLESETWAAWKTAGLWAID